MIIDSFGTLDDTVKSTRELSSFYAGGVVWVIAAPEAASDALVVFIGGPFVSPEAADRNMLVYKKKYPHVSFSIIPMKPCEVTLDNGEVWK